MEGETLFPSLFFALLRPGVALRERVTIELIEQDRNSTFLASHLRIMETAVNAQIRTPDQLKTNMARRVYKSVTISYLVLSSASVSDIRIIFHSSTISSSLWWWRPVRCISAVAWISRTVTGLATTTAVRVTGVASIARWIRLKALPAVRSFR